MCFRLATVTLLMCIYIEWCNVCFCADFEGFITQRWRAVFDSHTHAYNRQVTHV